jgi:hypothetical protein
LKTGDYQVELRDSGGVAIPGSTYTFGVNFSSEYDAHSGPQPTAVPGSEPNTGSVNAPPPFSPNPTVQQDVSFIIPWNPAAVSIALVHAGQVLDQVFVSPNAPQVFFTSPSGAESWLAGSEHALTWAGSDLDGDALHYSVFYSGDGGASWGLLASNLEASSLNILTDSLAGGSDVRFRVVVTDGVNTSQDETDEAISVPNKLPNGTILSPITNVAYPPGGLVVLQGMGVDLEDGTIPDENLHWSSDRQGSLGSGPSVGLNTLERGWHTITLTVVDSNGASSIASIQVFIGTQIYLPSLVK